MNDPIPLNPAPPPDPEVFDASDPAKVADRKKRWDRIEAQRMNGLRQIMESPDGRVWMWDLLAWCHVWGSPFNADANVHYFNSGMQNVGLKIMSELASKFPKAYLKLLEEGEPK